MTSPAKLYAKLIANPAATISFRDFERLLVAFGFVLRRTRGSHRQYRHPSTPGVLPVQPRGGDAVDYQVRRFLAIVQECGLRMAE